MSEPGVEVLVLTKGEIESLINRKDVTDAVETAFRALGTGQLTMPQKEPMWIDDERQNFIIAMPTYLKSINTAGMKWADLYFKRDKKYAGIPSTWGDIIILNSPESGLPYAIMDGTFITNVRTGGGHAVVAAKYLAKKDSKTLALIGCGAEAYLTFPAFMDNFPIETVNLCDIRPEAMDALEKEMRKEFKKVKMVKTTSAQEAVKGAEIIVMITSAQRPVVHEPWVEPGAFVAGLYGFFDLDPVLSKKADKWVLGAHQSDTHLIVDDRGGPGLTMSVARADVYADMGEVITGIKKGRENDRERIVYTHLGMGAHDIALAQLAYERAVKKGIGVKVRLI